MDRQHNNNRLLGIVQRHQTASGAIAAPAVAHMIAELTALMDECVTEANNDGYEEAIQR